MILGAQKTHKQSNLFTFHTFTACKHGVPEDASYKHAECGGSAVQSSAATLQMQPAQTYHPCAGSCNGCAALSCTTDCI